MPDIPGKPLVNNIKSRSAVITWEAANDHLESRLKRYVIKVLKDIYTVTSEIEMKKMTYLLQNLTEYTYYNVSIAAESAIDKSRFTDIVTFLTLCK